MEFQYIDVYVSIIDMIIIFIHIFNNNSIKELIMFMCQVSSLTGRHYVVFES